MQTYSLNLSNGASRSFSTDGDLFVYESGQVAGDDKASARIIVKPDSGGEITLRPGQQFRLPKGSSAMQWYVRAVEGSGDITGFIIIGAGEFDDANTLNTFKLDGTFTNAVKVTNTDVERVPVSLDSNQSIKTEAAPMSFTSYRNLYVSAGNVSPLILPAQNVNGVIIESLYASAKTTFLAQRGTPVTSNDGAIIDVFLDGTSGPRRARIALAPGMGLYASAAAAADTSLLYTAR